MDTRLMSLLPSPSPLPHYHHVIWMCRRQVARLCRRQAMWLCHYFFPVFLLSPTMFGCQLQVVLLPIVWLLVVWLQVVWLWVVWLQIFWLLVQVNKFGGVGVRGGGGGFHIKNKGKLKVWVCQKNLFYLAAIAWLFIEDSHWFMFQLRCWVKSQSLHIYLRL